MNANDPPSKKEGNRSKQKKIFPGPNAYFGDFLKKEALKTKGKWDVVQGPLYIPPQNQSQLAPKNPSGLPNPNKDRTAWVIGTTKDDLAYYSNIADTKGPYLIPDMGVVKRKANRVKFSKQGRFKSIKGKKQSIRRYISKGHNMAYLCTESPGPLAYTQTINPVDLNRPRAPKWGIGDPTKFNTTRASFLESKIKGGYLYRAKAATAERIIQMDDGVVKEPGVGPAAYEPDMKVIKRTYNRQGMDRMPRFDTKNKKPQTKRYISQKHTRCKVGLTSPGPIYEFQAREMGYQSQKKANSSKQDGAWCP